MDLLDTFAGIAVVLIVIQFVETQVAFLVDLGIVFRGVWVPLMRETPPEDRPYLWKAIAKYAKDTREGMELDARLREQRDHAGR